MYLVFLMNLIILSLKLYLLINALLVIHGLGLGGFYAGYVTAACQKETSIPKLLNIPKDHRICGCLAIGYPKLIYENWIERKPPQIKWM